MCNGLRLVPRTFHNPLPHKSLTGLKTNGGGGNRTRVPGCFYRGVYACSLTIDLATNARLDTLVCSQPGWSRLKPFGPQGFRPACISYASADAASGASALTWLELTSVRQPLPGCPGLRKDSHLKRARCFTRPPCNLDAQPPMSTIRSKPVRPRNDRLSILHESLMSITASRRYFQKKWIFLSF